MDNLDIFAQMKPEEQRILIAEACPNLATLNEEGELVWKNWPVLRYFDPLNDLNAMHKAEMSLPEILYLDWVQNMEQMFFGPSWRMNLYRATAAQRAEVFLRTIGKWKD